METRRDELIGGRGDAPARRRPRVAAIVVVALVLAALAADRWERSRQLDRLLAGVEAGEAVIAQAADSQTRLLDFAGPLNYREDVPPAQRSAVRQRLVGEAAQWPPRLAGPRASVAAVRPLPWHGDLRRARQAYLQRLDAWAAAMTGLEDASRPVPDAGATGLARERAAAALAAATGSERDDRVRRLLRRLERGGQPGSPHTRGALR